MSLIGRDLSEAPPIRPAYFMFWVSYFKNQSYYYPLWNPRFSITQSDFIQRRLGFQICWANHPDPRTRFAGFYTVTVPQWFVLILSLPLPLLWLRRVRRQRYRRRHNLCLVCGYDLRASKDRCPECGTGISAGRGLGAEPVGHV